MTRLVVKNLPLKITEQKLRSTFSSKGTITDLQLKYTKDGKFRGFAFIGYNTTEEAENARKYFDGTYIGAAVINVQSCSNLGDAKKFKKESKQDELKHDKSLKEKEKKKKKAESILTKYKDDPKFQEFLKAHKHNDTESWTNDSIVEVANLYAEKTRGRKNTIVTNEEQSSVETEDSHVQPTKLANNNKYFHVKLTNLPYKFKKKQVKAFLHPLKPPSVRVPPKIHGIAYVGFKTEKEQNQALNKHKSLWEGHQIFVSKYERKDDNGEKGEATNEITKWKEQEESMLSTETVGESGRLFARNLSYSTSEDELRELFSKYGPLTEVNLPIDRITRRIKGFAFITYMMPEHAVQAFTDLDGTAFHGRLLHLIPGKAKDESGGDNEKDGFKKNKAMKERSTASSSHNWNSLFLGSSAVADIMSEKYNVDKADVVLGDEAGGKSAAVRLALGETQIVQDTKKYLLEEGIRLEAFEKPPAVRSKTVIIAKNLPANTGVEEIRTLFSKYGVLGRVVIPVAGITAVIEFSDPGEARSAFTNLAYTKFHSTPLYLEWAPENAFTTEYEQSRQMKPVVAQDDEDEGEECIDNPEPGTTLFVKNLNFATSSEQLTSHFARCGKIFSATIATKKNAKTGENLSMGFGFVTYWHKSSSEQALKELQHSQLNSHSLELKRSNRATVENSSNKRKEEQVRSDEPSTKILVRNIAFQATKQEVTEIFKTYGELTSVRLPSKMSGTGSHRGFAFIEFATKSDAKLAMKELSGSTHLYGRRLVLEWAEQEESLETLRKRTAEQFDVGRQSIGKRKKFEMPAPTPGDGDD